MYPYLNVPLALRQPNPTWQNSLLQTHKTVVLKSTYLSFNDAGSELHDDGLDSVSASPSSGCQQLHTDGTALHDEASLYPRRYHSHERRREGEVVWECDLQEDVGDMLLSHIGR